MPETVGADSIQRTLARMAERGMTEIMAERDSLGQVAVKQQSARNSPCDLSHFKSMSQSCAVVIALG